MGSSSFDLSGTCRSLLTPVCPVLHFLWEHDRRTKGRTTELLVFKGPSFQMDGFYDCSPPRRRLPPSQCRHLPRVSLWPVRLHSRSRARGRGGQESLVAVLFNDIPTPSPTKVRIASGRRWRKFSSLHHVGDEESPKPWMVKTSLVPLFRTPFYVTFAKAVCTRSFHKPPPH